MCMYVCMRMWREGQGAVKGRQYIFLPYDGHCSIQFSKMNDSEKQHHNSCPNNIVSSRVESCLEPVSPQDALSHGTHRALQQEHMRVSRCHQYASQQTVSSIHITANSVMKIYSSIINMPHSREDPKGTLCKGRIWAQCYSTCILSWSRHTFPLVPVT